MKRSRLLTIAKYSIWEAVRDKFFLFILMGLLLTFALSLFVGELAITEGIQTQVAILAALLRLFLVFTISLFVITSMLREFNDKGFELLLSQPLPRSTYYIGKLLGYTFISFIVCIFAAACLFVYLPSSATLLWAFSLWCEVLIIISLSILCLFTLNSVTISFSVVMAFYILARAIEAIYLISHSTILSSVSLANQFMIKLIDIIVYLIPDLYRFTQTDWLIYKTHNADEFFMIIGQTFIYVLFLSAMAIFDLYKKEL